MALVGDIPFNTNTTNQYNYTQVFTPFTAFLPHYPDSHLHDSESQARMVGYCKHCQRCPNCSDPHKLDYTTT